MSVNPVEVVSRVDGEESKYTPEELEEALGAAKQILLSEREGAVIVITKNKDAEGMGYIKVGGMSPAEVVMCISESLGVEPLTLVAIAAHSLKHVKTTQPKATEEAQKEGTESAEGAKE